MEVFSVCVVVMNEDGKVLSVSRKNDHDDMGLVGGKIDEGESALEALIREVKEETGYDLYDTEFQFYRTCPHNGVEKLAAVYTGKVRGEMGYDEPHVVKWVHPSVVTKGSFGHFNTATFERLKINFNDK